MDERLHTILILLTSPVSVIIEFISLFVAIVTIVKACYLLFFVDKLDFTAFNERTTLPSGMITSLEIMLMAEVLKLLRVVEFADIITMFFLIIIHIILSYVLKRDVNEKIVVVQDEECGCEEEDKGDREGQEEGEGKREKRPLRKSAVTEIFDEDLLDV